MLYHVRMKRENVETRGQNCYNYGVWCKIHKNPQSLTVIAPNKPTVQQENRLLREKVKEVEKERDALLLSLSLQSKSTEKQKAVEYKGNSLLDVTL